jgi:RNase P subunit RPR2
MVEVVGKDETAVKRVTCKGCASILEYTSSEVKAIKHSYDYLGDYEVSYGFKCPNCDNNVFPRNR